MKIKELRWMDMGDLRALCISHNWFTRGDCKAHDHFLRMPYNAKYEHRNVTTKLLYNMAQTIMQYSDPETYDILEVTGIMYCLAKICFTTFYTED